MKKIIGGALAALLVAGGIAFASSAANATGYPPEECVPSEGIPAWTEVVPDIEHPAIGTPTITVENPDYKPAVEGTAAVWANFSPNNHKEPFEGPPAYPTDERGTWQVHDAIPGGHEGPDGVYSKGNPHKGGNWFYRQAAVPGTPAEGEPTIEVENPDYVAPWTEVTPDIEHPAVPPVTCEQEPEYPTNECTTGVSTHSTNLADLWADVDTRSKGHVEYVEGGLHVWTDDNSSQAKVSEGIPVNYPLHDVGVLDLDWTGTSPAPGINLFVNFGEDGNGTLVYEEVYGQDLWLTNGSSAAVKANAPVNGGGNGSQWHGTIDQWLTKYPDATVYGLAYSLGSGVHGDGVITAITAGCGTHTFDVEVIIPEKPEPTVTVETEDVVDCDNATVTTTTTTTTTDWVYDEQSNTWVEGEPVVETSSEERSATAEECPVVTPTPTPTPTATPTPAPVALAVTGGDNLANVGWLTLGSLAVALGGLLTVLGLRRRQVKSE